MIRNKQKRGQWRRSGSLSTGQRLNFTDPQYWLYVRVLESWRNNSASTRCSVKNAPTSTEHWCNQHLYRVLTAKTSKLQEDPSRYNLLQTSLQRIYIILDSQLNPSQAIKFWPRRTRPLKAPLSSTPRCRKELLNAAACFGVTVTDNLEQWLGSVIAIYMFATP